VITSSGGVRHRLSGGSASALSYAGEKYRDRSGRADERVREKEDDTKSVENVSGGVLPSRQSILDLVSGKFMGRHTPTYHYYQQQQQQQVGFRGLARERAISFISASLSLALMSVASSRRGAEGCAERDASTALFYFPARPGVR